MISHRKRKLLLNTFKHIKSSPIETPGLLYVKVAATALPLSTMTPALGGDRLDNTRKLRNFAEILNEEKHHRNILEVKLVRTNFIDEKGEQVKVKTLNEEDLSEFLFDVIGLKMEDCLGIALRTHRYDTKEIKLKKGVNPAPYLTVNPVMFKGHQISIMKQMNNLTRVTFRNVPFNIPDEEIIHLCKVYGDTLNDQVHYEKPNRNTRGVPGSNRYVEMKISPGKQFENFYWMEGPLSGDQGCRVTVLHNGQVQQCSHCLRREDLCPGGGNGRACEGLKTQRGKISEYMKYLRVRQGYTSMKMEYMQTQFPALGGQQDTDNGFGHMVEAEAETQAEFDDPDTDGGNQVSQKHQSDLNVLKQQLLEAEAKVRAERSIAKETQTCRKSCFSKDCGEHARVKL